MHYQLLTNSILYSKPHALFPVVNFASYKVSGGRDNPHFTNGDPSIAISDVLKAGPAEGKLMINDRVISANSVSLEGVDYATAVQVLRDSGQTVNLVVKRRVVLPSVPEPQNVRVSLTKNKKKEDFGVVLGCKIYIKEITSRSVAEKEGSLQEGDLVHRINNLSLDGLSLKEARKLLDSAKDKLEMTVRRDPFRNSQPRSGQPKVENGAAEPNQNLYVPPPSRKEEKNNLAREARMGEEDAPPRPPLPREEGNTLCARLLMLTTNATTTTSSTANCTFCPPPHQLTQAQRRLGRPQKQAHFPSGRRFPYPSTCPALARANQVRP